PTAMLLIHYLKSHQIPYFLSSDGGFVSNNETKIKYVIKKYFMSGAEGYFSPGKGTNKYLEWYGAQRERIIEYPFTSISETDVVGNPLSETQKRKLRNKLGLSKEHLILSVGQFIPRKGMDTLIQAGNLLSSNINICIVGGEPSEDYLRLAKESQGANIEFRKFMSKGELAEYYKAADVFALATREDIWGLVINEAMSYGLPTVTTTACMAGLEMIKNGRNGFLVSPDDPILFAQKINEILYDVKYTDMQNECLKVARKYTIENMAKVYLESLI
ncbi:MAG: glycosyltransferase family 4 protein, partial [Bacteroides sp.]|nr:glycosyltransferase family 4 protein [Bacteroides sp.]